MKELDIDIIKPIEKKAEFKKYYKIIDGKLKIKNSTKDETLNGFELYDPENKDITKLLNDKKVERELTEKRKRLNFLLKIKLNDFRKYNIETLQVDTLEYEYTRKEARAKEAKLKNDYSFFDDIAKDYDLTSEELVNSILEQSKSLREKEDRFIFKLGVLRSKFNGFYQTKDLDNLTKTLEEIENINLEEHL